MSGFFVLLGCTILGLFIDEGLTKLANAIKFTAPTGPHQEGKDG